MRLYLFTLQLLLAPKFPVLIPGALGPLLGGMRVTTNTSAVYSHRSDNPAGYEVTGRGGRAHGEELKDKGMFPVLR